MRCPRVVVALLLLTACTSDERRPDPDAELRDARARLATLARATANGTYDAEYRFHQVPSDTTGTIRIRQDPPQYRIDIASKDGASFFALTTGVVSCSAEKPKGTCFLVARPGEDVPSLFDPGVQRLFRDAVEDLATNPGGYLVTRVAGPPAPAGTPTGSPAGSPIGSGAASPSASPAGSPARSTPGSTPGSGSPGSGSPGTLPAGECFRVERVGRTPEPGQPAGFEDGTYCFAEQGVATSITVSSGSLTLVRLGSPPGPDAFTPPARVQRLPDLTPTPTASARPTSSPSR